MRKLTQDEFLEKAKAVHGDFYDYSEVNYVNDRTKLKIICPIHGCFQQSANKHLQGHGCPTCGIILASQKRSLTTNGFINQANKIHKGRYDYSRVKYINRQTKVKIICPIHGEFLQSPSNHLSGHGCYLCFGTKKLTKDDFIERAKQVHGNKYDYSKVKYDNIDTPVIIKCPIHGEFSQTPNNHLQGKQCKLCANRSFKYTLEEFIEKANSKHNNFYDYSKVEYINGKTKVKIICPEHGEFYQAPVNHLSGQGCRRCYIENRDIKSFVEKTTNTKRENKTFTTSSVNDSLYLKLNSKYSSVLAEYKDARYPFLCDFYIPERDLFIELNAHWTHNPKLGWYNPDETNHLEKEEEFSKKSSSSKFYKIALEVWTERDVLKRKTAKKNNLNYVVLWNEQDIEDWFALGCPDGHDGDGMYTWKENSEENQ